MKLNQEMHEIITLAVKSAIGAVGLEQVRNAFSGLPTRNAGIVNGPLPPIV